MNRKITREDLEHRLGGSLGFKVPIIGEITARQTAGILAVVVVVVARVCQRIFSRSRS